MPDAYFALAQPSAQAFSTSARYRASAATAGPWDPRLQHGGPPSALLVLVAERLAVTQTGRTDLVAVRYAGEFVGPVPVGDVDVAARVVRDARSGVLVALSLTARERVCLEARVWLIRDADTTSVAHAGHGMPVPADAPGLGGSFPYADSIEWRAERGSLAESRARDDVDQTADPRPRRRTADRTAARGPRRRLRERGVGRTRLERVVVPERGPRRAPGPPGAGHWLRMEATTQLGAHGSALARSVLSDESGPVGTTAQTLVLSPRTLSTP